MIDVAVLVVAGIRATDTLVFVVFVLGGEHLERAVISRVLDGGHVFAEGVAVDVMWAGTRHRGVSHVVDGDHVLVGFGILVTLVGDVDESGGIDVEGEPFPLCAFHAVSSASSSLGDFVDMVFPECIRKTGSGWS